MTSNIVCKDKFVSGSPVPPVYSKLNGHVIIRLSNEHSFCSLWRNRTFQPDFVYLVCSS